MQSPITIRLGRRARARIAENGVRASDIAIVPAAAGGGEQSDLVGQQRHGAIIPAPVAGRGGRHAQA